MGAIRKISHTRQMPDFRRRLQRALSLSSSESEDSRSPSRSLSGDTTEEESSTHLNKNDQAAPQQGNPPSSHEHELLPSYRYGGHGSQPGDNNVLILKCLAELVLVTPLSLDVRVKSLDCKLTDQSKFMDDIRRDLADLLRRLEVIETEAEERSKSDGTHTPDEPEQKTARTRRPKRPKR